MAPRFHQLSRRKTLAYGWLYDFTHAACDACAQTDCACKDSICAHVQSGLRARGVEIPETGARLRFLGCAGCVVPPHLRETCTIYLCAPARAKPGFDRDRYDRLVRLCEKIDYQIMELEEQS